MWGRALALLWCMWAARRGCCDVLADAAEERVGMTLQGTGPHGGQPVIQAGAVLQGARSAMVLVHGRGDSASGILQLADAFPMPRMAYLAPQASGNTWYPNRFL